MPPPEKLIGIVGKTNVGKSTLFAAMTLIPVKIADHPFTTIEPNVGVSYVRRDCAHVKLGLQGCNPRSGLCAKGSRFIPVKVIDVAGLIPGASKGRGLGNKFMDDLRQADVLIHIVDASGSTDLEGNKSKPGTHDPAAEAELILAEINEWFKGVVMRVWSSKIAKSVSTAQNPVDLIYQSLSGISIKRKHVVEAIKRAELDSKHPKLWGNLDIERFAVKLREASKPILIAANKVDYPEAVENVKRLVQKFGAENVVPVSALAELILRRASQSGILEYLPGDVDFEVKAPPEKLTREHIKALDLIRDSVMKVYGSTGVEELLRRAILNKLKMITVYPVEDENKYVDHYGNVLPDAYLVEQGTTARELAYMIHTDLGEGFLYALDAVKKKRVGESYVLGDNDVIKIVAAKSK